jgi:beta-phosphoglucomutase-like phosphatase (HAD superfamily)
MMLEAVVFNLDGLRVDSEAQQIEAYRLAFAEFD